MRGLVVLSFFISFIVLLMTLSIYLYYITPVSEFSYSASAFVTKDTAGFDLNSTAITFGSFTVGGSSTRSIAINNSFPFPIKVEPEFEGSIDKLINYEHLIVQPYEVSKFSLVAYAESPELIGEYNGTIIIRLMRV